MALIDTDLDPLVYEQQMMAFSREVYALASHKGRDVSYSTLPSL
jgi:hypothetical protein